MNQLDILHHRLLSGDPDETVRVLADAETAGISLAVLLQNTLLGSKLDIRIETAEHIDSMFEDDFLFTHFWGSDGRFELKSQSFSYYDSGITGEEIIRGTWQLAGMKPGCYVLKLNGTVIESTKNRVGEQYERFFMATAENAETGIVFPDWEDEMNRWMTA